MFFTAYKSHLRSLHYCSLYFDKDLGPSPSAPILLICSLLRTVGLRASLGLHRIFYNSTLTLVCRPLLAAKVISIARISLSTPCTIII